jgi:hypothetical protein
MGVENQRLINAFRISGVAEPNFRYSKEFSTIPKIRTCHDGSNQS